MPSRSTRNNSAGPSCAVFALSIVGVPLALVLYSLFTPAPETHPPVPRPSASLTFPWTTAPPPAVTICRDGSVSHSTGRGTCSHHGGIR